VNSPLVISYGNFLASDRGLKESSFVDSNHEESTNITDFENRINLIVKSYNSNRKFILFEYDHMGRNNENVFPGIFLFSDLVAWNISRIFPDFATQAKTSFIILLLRLCNMYDANAW
jgi:hypothetical protein